MNCNKYHRTCLYVTSSVVIMLVYGCSKSSVDQYLFQKLPSKETGITFENALEEEELFNSINYLYFYDGGGVAVGDINNDGLPDIYFTANMVSNHLYLNKGDFQFQDITKTAGVGGGIRGWTTGATMADVNGDGFLDLLGLTDGSHRPRLWLNQVN